MSHAGMTCKQLVELTTEYFEGTLFPPDRVRFQAHLKTCAHCASYVEQMCQTIKALGRLPGGTVAGHVMEALYVPPMAARSSHRGFLPTGDVE